MSIETALKKLNEPYYAGTQVVNCVAHSDMDMLTRPRACDLCATDIKNHLARAIDVNKFLNDKVAAAIAELA